MTKLKLTRGILLAVIGACCYEAGYVAGRSAESGECSTAADTLPLICAADNSA